MTGRIRACRFGVAMLRIFWWTTLVAGIALAVSLTTMLTVSWPASWTSGGWVPWLVALGVVVVAESVVFWIGIITVYLTSVQLGLKIRVIGVLCGWIPIANLVALHLIIRTVAEEVRFESAKERLDRSRAAARVCATRYPILFVHGVFFRDTKALNYWGRVPAELERNGAVVYYGEHQSAASVADSARELTEHIRQIVETTGCGKVNVIAHSKGGLDMRYAIARCGAGRWVASLTTINTPHRGCGFADYLLMNIPLAAQRRVEAAYNMAASHLGDKRPDFMAAVHDLTQAGCAQLNAEIGDAALLEEGARAAASGMAGTVTAPGDATAVPDSGPFAGILCRSVGSKLAHATTGKFPLNFTYPLVKWFDGPNDGLVARPSFPWGESFTWLEPNGVRGISHADMIDLNRENIPGFDVREFYVGLVADLKRRGL
ncbi:esterase/lipase family protein [Bifidobacterium stellenboschense]|uniref:Triacylglycerol lipase n=1 Tax=Bifidobacterium stellenboschense TaxID=762211 RepID=A0A087DR91_9BIFI|nr:triacylglycerol lipase [Bifidobacterium stellenboschense]KFI98041.1 triacylglycerol lipase [Bifidobacterium stellenboschense]